MQANIEDLIAEFSDLQIKQLNSEHSMAPAELRRSARIKQSTKSDSYIYFNLTNSRATNFKRRKKRPINHKMVSDQEMDDNPADNNGFSQHNVDKFRNWGRGRGIASQHSNTIPGGLNNMPPGVNTIDKPYNNTRPDTHTINGVQRSPVRQKCNWKFTDKTGKPITILNQAGQPVLPYDPLGNPIQLVKNNKPIQLQDRNKQPIYLFDDKRQPINQLDINIANIPDSNDSFDSNDSNLGATGGLPPPPTTQYPASEGFFDANSLNVEGNLKSSAQLEFERKQLEDMANRDKTNQIPLPIPETHEQMETRIAYEIKKAQYDKLMEMINKNANTPLIDIATPDRNRNASAPQPTKGSTQLPNKPNNPQFNKSNNAQPEYCQVFQSYPSFDDLRNTASKQPNNNNNNNNPHNNNNQNPFTPNNNSFNQQLNLWLLSQLNNTGTQNKMKEIRWPENLKNFNCNNREECISWIGRLREFKTRRQLTDAEFFASLSDIFPSNSKILTFYEARSSHFKDFPTFQSEFEHRFVPPLNNIMYDRLTELQNYYQVEDQSFNDFSEKMRVKGAHIQPPATEAELFYYLMKNKAPTYDKSYNNCRNLKDLEEKCREFDNELIKTYVWKYHINEPIHTIEQMAQHKFNYRNRNNKRFNSATINQVDVNNQVHPYGTMQPQAAYILPQSALVQAQFATQANTIPQSQFNAMPQQAYYTQPQYNQSVPMNQYAPQQFPKNNVSEQNINNENTMINNDMFTQAQPNYSYAQVVQQQQCYPNAPGYPRGYPPQVSAAAAQTEKKDWVYKGPKYNPNDESTWPPKQPRPYLKGNCFECGWPGYPVHQCPRCLKYGRYNKDYIPGSYKDNKSNQQANKQPKPSIPLFNEQHQRVDRNGKLINEQGLWIDENGSVIRNRRTEHLFTAPPPNQNNQPRLTGQQTAQSINQFNVPTNLTATARQQIQQMIDNLGSLNLKGQI